MVIRPKVHGFLDRELPGLLGVVGTNSEDGFPHLVPVWYRWDGARVHIWTREGRIWVRNLARDPRAGFSVQEPAEPYGAVTMKGSAKITSWDDERVSAEIERITRRYVPPLDVAGYIHAWRGLRTIVSITPKTVVYRSD
jgi:PPOX class probable F420-dependent enzyme